MNLDTRLLCAFAMADPVPSTFVEVVTVEQLDGTVVVASDGPPSTVLTEITVNGLDT